MKNRNLLLTLFLASVIAIGTQSSFAADTATQNLNAGMTTLRNIATNGGTVNTSIDPADGALASALTPGFTVSVNSSALQNVIISGTCTGATSQNALYDRSGTKYIVLANSTTAPTNEAITDCKAATPVATQNANAISYTLSVPADTPGEVEYTWDTPTATWNMAVTKAGNTNTTLTSGTAAYTGTHSVDDTYGDYKAAVTLTFT